ncbi:Uncharacterized membrane protein [Nonomuraea maritima]|uniref:Uncharacterized membrane protein n=1 Tax=Nonomuraea maritima TaxID=683260 RepID=A0A1G9AMK2_9ACTN|nr:DUF2254 domain-containing protein [Nonomuraea maritima]SDK28609.1 Uncharacterized membrane protein [Nonomuraea maritima]
MNRWSVLVDNLRSQLWPLPALALLLALLLGVGLPRFDAAMNDSMPPGLTAWLFSGGPEAARTVLSAVASSLITVTSLTFSLTVVTLQLASSQYSPRVLRTFAADPFVHVTLSLLLGTFVYSLTVLRTVRASLDDQDAFVPQVSVTVGFVLGVASVGMLVGFLAHLARQIRVESILRQVHADTEATMRHVYGDERDNDGIPQVPPTPGGRTVSLCAGSSGFLTAVEGQPLLGAALETGAVVVLADHPGDFLIAGTPVAVAWAAEGGELDESAVTRLVDALNGALRTDSERTAAQDPEFGLRQIIDIAVRALSPGVNDPTTAVHALSHAAALLCEAAHYRLGSRLLHDDAGRVRVVLPRPDFAAMLDLVLTQPRRYGSDDPYVLARMFTLLREVAWTTRSPEHHRAVSGQLARLTDAMHRHSFDERERARLQELEQSVRQALAGHWPVTSA